MDLAASKVATRPHSFRTEHALALAVTAAKLERALRAFRLAISELGDTPGQAEAIREAISSLDRAFTPADVRARLPANLRGISTVNISTVLLRLTQRGKLRLVERGSGRRQSIYERADFKPEDEPSDLSE